MEILPSAWVQTSFRHGISNQTSGVPEAFAARRFSSGMARISAVLSSRSPGQRNVNRFSFGDICPYVWIGVTDSKKAQAAPMVIRILPAAIRANPFYPVRPYRSLCRYESVRQCTLCPFTPGGSRGRGGVGDGYENVKFSCIQKGLRGKYPESGNKMRRRGRPCFYVLHP